jgi:hypothetical protein
MGKDQMNMLVPAQYDETALADLTPEERAVFLAMQQDELQHTLSGVDLQLSKVKINKDLCQFVDESGETVRELVGVIVYKDKTRGYWDRSAEDNVPECSSIGGVTGTTRGGETRSCANCPYNQWGSAVDEKGEPMKGKACKEMRRIYLASKNTAVPIFVTLPPTSIGAFDKYISARVTKKITDLARETKITLTPEKGGKFTYAVAQFALGEPVSPKDQLAYYELRKWAKAHADRTPVEVEDYDVTDTTAEPIDDDKDPF